MADENEFEQQPGDQQPEPAAQLSDPISEAVEAITFGSEDANQKLRSAIDVTVDQRERWKRLADRNNQTAEVVKGFLRDNPELVLCSVGRRLRGCCTKT
jgi:hypothetical protein